MSTQNDKFIDLTPIVTQSETDLYAASKNGMGSVKETRQQMVAYAKTALTANKETANLAMGASQSGLGGGSVGTALTMSLNTAEIFDTEVLNEESIGFNGSVFDGQYLYMCSALDGLITRYNTKSSFNSADSYSFFSTLVLNPESYGYSGGVFDGRYIYFIPLLNGEDRGSHIFLRYDTTKDFENQDSYSIFVLSAININCKGFNGAVFDGRYIYLVPFVKPILTRYDTTLDFESVGSYTTFDITATVGAGAGFVGGTFDGRYVYFSPSINTLTSSESGLSFRYDTTLSFTSPGSYQVFDLTTISPHLIGFGGNVFDGKYLYYVPFVNGHATSEIVRFDTRKSFTSTTSYDYYDTTLANPNSGGFNGGVFDGKYLYMIPFLSLTSLSGLSGLVARYDVTKPFSSSSSYEFFDATTLDPDSLGFNGGMYDGEHLYLIPFYTVSYFSGKLFRMTAYSGPQIPSELMEETVGNTQMAFMPTMTIKGNNTGGSTNPIDLTVSQINTMLGFSTANTYAVTIGDGTNNFTTSTASGVYYKIGSLYHVQLRIVWTDKGSAVAGSAIRISLPTAIGASTGAVSGCIGYANGVGFTGSYLSVNGITGNSYLVLNGMENTGLIAPSPVLVSQLAAAGELNIGLTYWNN